MVYVQIRTTTYDKLCQLLHTFVYALITLFNASTVGYNTIQQQPKYLCSANPLSSIVKNTFFTIAENNFYTIAKWHAPVTIS